jgi:hypothetical protein
MRNSGDETEQYVFNKLSLDDTADSQVKLETSFPMKYSILPWILLEFPLFWKSRRKTQ